MSRDSTAFRERFKAYKNGKSVSEIYDAGLPKFGGGKQALTQAQKNKIDQLYQILQANGFDPISASGIIGNAMQESSLNPDTVSRSGYSGLFQNNKQLQQAIVEQYGDHSLESQMKFVNDWASGSDWVRKGKHSAYIAYKSGQFKRTGYRNAQEASDAFMQLYERPAIYDKSGKFTGWQNQAERINYSNQVYDYLSSIAPQPKSELVQSLENTPQFNPPPVKVPITEYSPYNTAPEAISSWNGAESPSYTPIQLQARRNTQNIKGALLNMLMEDEEPNFTLGGFSNGKLPFFQGGKQPEIKQGPTKIPIDKAQDWAEDSDNDTWGLYYLKDKLRPVINFVKDVAEPYRNIINGRGTKSDLINIGIDVGASAGGRALNKMLKPVKSISKGVKPKEVTSKFKTNNPNEVGLYYANHPEEITSIVNSRELQNVVDFANNYTGPRYLKRNKVKIGINPEDVKLGYADMSGTGLGGYTTPTGEIVLNKDIINNSQLMEDVLGHEFNGHYVNNRYPINAQQASEIQHYIQFDPQFLKTHPFFNTTEEGLAVYRQLQNIASRENNITGRQLDRFMENIPAPWLKRNLHRIGYGNVINWKFPDVPVKQLSKSVPTFIGGSYLLDDTAELKTNKKK